METTSKTQQGERAESWPALPFEAWKDTCQTLHLWTQIVGKVRMELSPLVNHWWHVTLYVTPRGLTTSPIPYQGRTFAVNFDFIDPPVRRRFLPGIYGLLARFGDRSHDQHVAERSAQSHSL